MRRIVIIETRNGVLVVDGEAHCMIEPKELAAKAWTFNSLDKAITQIRCVLTKWRDREAAQAAGGK